MQFFVLLFKFLSHISFVSFATNLVANCNEVTVQKMVTYDSLT